jgi:hypothetical protein
MRSRGSFLFDFGQFLPDLSVGGTLGIVDLDELPPHHALGVNDVSGRMRPPPAVGVEYAIAIDDFVVFVFQQRKVELSFESIAQHLGKFFRVFMAVGTDGQDLNLLFLLFRQ